MFDARGHHRRSIRLAAHDYRSTGVYFVTVCTERRRCGFGHITDGVMRPNIKGLSPVVVWQRNFYERVIRDEQELENARRYILENPERWNEDQENPRVPL